MEKTAKDNQKLNTDMEHILADAENFLSHLKGLRHTKGLVKNDIQHLKAHLHRLTEHLNHLEQRHTP